MIEGQRCSHLPSCRFEQVRLASFEFWNGDRSIIYLLARAGFFSIPEGNLVQCFACNLKFDPSNKDDMYITLRDHAKICSQLYDEALPRFSVESSLKSKSENSFCNECSSINPNSCCEPCLDFVVKLTITVLRNLVNNSQ